MEPKTEIHAVEVVRRIRDEQAEMLQGKSAEEIIDFFRRAGDAAKSRERRGKSGGGEGTALRDGVGAR